jgi:hypothetical protein
MLCLGAFVALDYPGGFLHAQSPINTGPPRNQDLRWNENLRLGAPVYQLKWTAPRRHGDLEKLSRNLQWMLISGLVPKMELPS